MPENPTTALVKTTHTLPLQTNIQALQESETYQTISQLTDWDVYFAGKRQQLEEQLEAIAV